MSKIVVHAGDYIGTGNYVWGSIQLKSKRYLPFPDVMLKLGDLESVEMASEANVKKLASTVGWGAVGGLALGPVGLLAGLIAGGRKNEVTFVARFKNGKRILATADRKAFLAMQAAVF